MYLHYQQMHMLTDGNELAAVVWANENEKMESQLVPQLIRPITKENSLMLCYGQQNEFYRQAPVALGEEPPEVLQVSEHALPDIVINHAYKVDKAIRQLSVENSYMLDICYNDDTFPKAQSAESKYARS